MNSKKCKKTETDRFPLGTKEEIQQRLLNDLFRQITPKEHCYFCPQGVSEADHLHASFLHLVPRCEPIIARFERSSYALDGKFLEGHRLVMTVDTSRADPQHCKLHVNTSSDSGYMIHLREKSRNFLEFVKIPIIPEEFVGKSRDSECQVAVKVNNCQPCIMNLDGRKSSAAFVSVLSDSVLVTAHWKQIPCLPLF